MAKRVITSITYDLKWDISTTPPTVHVSFTDVADDGSEAPHDTTFFDAQASALLPAQLVPNVNAAITAQQTATAPQSLPDKVAATQAQETRARAAAAAADAAQARADGAAQELAILDVKIDTAADELAALEKKIADARKSADALAAADADATVKP